MRRVGFIVALMLGFVGSAAAQGIGPGAGHPAGADTQVQFNASSLFGADSTFTFNSNTKVVTTANQFQKQPCDWLANGCIDAFSVIQRMTAAYYGSLFELWRDDGSTQQFGTDSLSGIVNSAAIHSFCDGHDCFFEYIYDQINPTNNLGPGPNWPAINTLPLLGWNTNGLPTAVMYRGAEGATGTLGHLTPTQNLGGFLISGVATGLPTTGSRTMYVLTDNFNWSEVAEFFSYTANSPNDIGGIAPVVMQTNPNTPSGAIFGMDLEAFIYDYGAYEAGYAQLAGLAKYNSATNQINTQVLTSTCIPGGANACNAQTTYSNYPNPSNTSYTINTGLGLYPLYFRLGQGTDSYAYGGRFQGAALASYVTSTKEDADVLNALAKTSFAAAPSPCGAVTSTLTAGIPNSSTTSVPQSYTGVPTPNAANLVAAYGANVVVPNWTGALFRVQRQDNNAAYEIYPLGCAADAQAIAQDCTGTTCWVTRWYDQSGHNWTLKAPSIQTAPTLSPAGIDGQPCVQFTAAASSPDHTFFTASLAINTLTTGTLTVTNIISGPALAVGQTLARQRSRHPYRHSCSRHGNGREWHIYRVIFECCREREYDGERLAADGDRSYRLESTQRRIGFWAVSEPND